MFVDQCGGMQANIDKKASPEDWRYREAATSAFGAILEGPTTERLSTYVAAGLGFLLNAMKDPNQQVRHTTAWTIGESCKLLNVHVSMYFLLYGSAFLHHKTCPFCAWDRLFNFLSMYSLRCSLAGRIFEFVHTPPVVNEQSLPQIVGILLASIRDLPLIAEKVCYALAQLAAGFKDSDQTSLLSPYFKDIVGALLDAVLHLRLTVPLIFNIFHYCSTLQGGLWAFNEP